METSYKTFGTRLSDDEQSYINNYFEGNFSRYVHNSIKRDIELSQRNRKINKLSQTSGSIIILLFSLFMFTQMWAATNLFANIAFFLIGTFLLVYGLIDIIKENLPT